MSESVAQRYKEMILRAMEYHFPGAKVYLFGSRARGTYKDGSDLDIAIDAGVKSDLYELERARVTLENLTILYKVDLVDMQRIPEKFKDAIIKEGLLWKK